jgi:DNA/RNA-binding domain of Phe-tRNA-synthetase-like protein
MIDRRSKEQTMINKDELLSLLKKDAMFEEDAVNKYSAFFQALKFNDEKDRQSIQDGMRTLKTDSEKHFNMINDMIKYAEGGSKDDF